MIIKEVTVNSSEGLRARSASNFTRKANTYKSSIWIHVDEKRANAKSLLGILSLGINKGMVISIHADGVDEIEAVNGLETYVISGLSE